ncbi:MAG: nucleoside phosphorylase [Candidatus Limnocylindrales bacterium]
MPTPARDLDPGSPLLEFDPSREAVIEPHASVRPFPVPEALVVCYFRDAIELLCAETGATVVGRLESEMGGIPVHAADWQGARIGIVQGGVGAPLAVGWLEELLAMGVRRVVVVGGAGALVPGLTLGHVVVPTSAVRDEGTSHHYLPASRTVEPTPTAVEAITRTLERRGVPYVSGATWTTDAIYRETRAKMERRVAEGCLTVEMEAAALFALARFRGIELGQMLYAGDDLSGESWDHRDWQGHATGRELLLRLACDALVEMGGDRGAGLTRAE